VRSRTSPGEIGGATAGPRRRDVSMKNLTALFYLVISEIMK
jgi:hypothetical protein